MPLYEYRCLACRKRFSKSVSYSDYDSFTPICPYCASDKVQRLISRVYTAKGGGGDDSDAADDLPSDIDENDPRSVGRWMRRMSEDSGEDLGPEFHEVIGRLEAGDDPEQIERDMPDLAGGAADAAEDAD